PSLPARASALRGGRSAAQCDEVCRLLHHQRVPRPPLPCAGAAAFDPADRGVPARAWPDLSWLHRRREPRLSGALSGRHSHDRPRAMASVRDRAPNGVHRHVSVLGAEGLNSLYVAHSNLDEVIFPENAIWDLSILAFDSRSSNKIGVVTAPR